MEDELSKATDKQVGGSHYKNFAIQPVEFCQKNGLNMCEASVIKYVCRHRNKNGIEDLKKAKHFIDLLIQLEYEDPSEEMTTNTEWVIDPADHYPHLKEDSGC